MKKKYKDIGEAEDDLGLGINEYLNSTHEECASAQEELATSPCLLDKLPVLNPSQVKELVNKGLTLLNELSLQEVLLTVIGQLENNADV